jgi:hypothetical protein
MANTFITNYTVTTSAAIYTISHNLGRTPHYFVANPAAVGITQFIVSEVSRGPTFLVLGSQAIANAQVNLAVVFIHSAVR